MDGYCIGLKYLETRLSVFCTGSLLRMSEQFEWMGYWSVCMHTYMKIHIYNFNTCTHVVYTTHVTGLKNCT